MFLFFPLGSFLFGRRFGVVTAKDAFTHVGSEGLLLANTLRRDAVTLSLSPSAGLQILLGSFTDLLEGLWLVLLVLFALLVFMGLFLQLRLLAVFFLLHCEI